VLLVYIALYVVGMLLGLAAKIALDVQLRRPGTRQLVGLIILVFLLWGAISVTHTPFTDVLLPLVWAGTGLLAGFGGPAGLVSRLGFRYTSLRDLGTAVAHQTLSGQRVNAGEALTLQEATIEIEYLGSVDQLKTNLAETNLDLVRGDPLGQQTWRLARSGAPAAR